MSGIIMGLATPSGLLKQSVKIDLIVDLSAQQNSPVPMICLPSALDLRVFFCNSDVRKRETQGGGGGGGGGGVIGSIFAGYVSLTYHNPYPIIVSV